MVQRQSKIRKRKSTGDRKRGSRCSRELREAKFVFKEKKENKKMRNISQIDAGNPSATVMMTLTFLKYADPPPALALNVIV